MPRVYSVPEVRPLDGPVRAGDVVSAHHAHLSPVTVRWLVFVVVASLIAGVVPVLLIAEVENVGRSDAWAITWGITVWAGIRLAHRVAAGKAALFDFMFWIFVYIFMGLAPTAQIRADEVSSTTPGMDPLLDGRIAGAVVLGLFSYEVGRFAARHLVPALRSKQVSEGGPSPDLFGGPGRRPLDVVPSRAVVLTLVGVLAAAYYVYRIGVSTLFMSRYSAFEIRSERMPDIATRSIVSAAGSYPLLIAASVYLRVWVTRALGERSGRHLPLLAVSVGALLLVVNPISAARYDFGTIVFALVVFAGAFGTLRRSRVTMAAVFTGFIFVFPIADAFRSNTLNTTRNGFFGEYLGNADYDGFWQIGNALSYADDGLVQPLRQALGVVLFWVPRAIWPDKPYDTGILLAQYRNYSFDNLSAPLWAELIVNGGLVLLVVGFVLVGVMLGRLDVRVADALVNAGHLWAIVGGVFSIYMIILLRGSLLQATGTLVVAIASVLYVFGRPPPTPAAAA